jgi:hypothetical protein
LKQGKHRHGRKFPKKIVKKCKLILWAEKLRLRRNRKPKPQKAKHSNFIPPAISKIVFNPEWKPAGLLMFSNYRPYIPNVRWILENIALPKRRVGLLPRKEKIKFIKAFLAEKAAAAAAETRRVWKAIKPKKPPEYKYVIGFQM